MAANFTPLSIPTTGKEAEPIAPKAPEQPVVAEVAKEHEPHPEVVPYVRARRETPQIDQELAAAGVQAHATPTFATRQEIKLPLTDEEVEEGLKEPVTSSFRWLATLCMRWLAQAHLTLKTVHGHVVRVTTGK